MGQWFATRSNFALSISHDAMTLVSAAGRRVRVFHIEVAGMGTASAANELIVARSSGGAGGGGAITPEPGMAEQAAVAAAVNTSWTTQPTLDDILKRMGVNANGGINRWAVPSWSPDVIELRNGAMLSLRSGLGTGNVSITIGWDEP